MITKVNIIKVGSVNGKRYMSFNINIDDLLHKLDAEIVGHDLGSLEDMQDFKSLLLHTFFSDVVGQELTGDFVDTTEIGVTFFGMINYIFNNVDDLEPSIYNLVNDFCDNTIDETNVIITNIKEYLTNNKDKLSTLVIHTEKIYFRDERLLTGVAVIKLEFDG